MVKGGVEDSTIRAQLAEVDALEGHCKGPPSSIKVPQWGGGSPDKADDNDSYYPIYQP